MAGPENKRRVMTRTEAAELKPQAERMVRAGMSRAEVGRQLGIHPVTLSQWALDGHWRLCDLEAERSGELRSAAQLRIDQAREREADRLAEQDRVRAEAEMRALEPDPFDADSWTIEALEGNPPRPSKPAPSGDPEFDAYRERVLAPLRRLAGRLARETEEENHETAEQWGEAAAAIELPGLLGGDD